MNKRNVVLLCLGFIAGPAAAEWGNGLGSEYKTILIPANQQSGWGYKTEIEKAPAVIAPAPVTAPVVAAPADSDNDGVIDSKDECQGTAAGIAVDASGCPQTVKAIQDTGVLTGVQFETGSDKIKPQSYATLDEAAQILNTRNTVRAEIQGHTDASGNAAKNQTLSDRRALSVKNYLVSKGVAADRLETVGYGSTKPLGDNKTAEGRAQNRRIEFKVLSR